MTDPFEQAIRDAAQGLGSSGEQPTYHDAWARGTRRRMRKRAALALTGALALVAAFGLNSNRLGTPSVEVDDIAIDLDVATAVPEAATGSEPIDPTTVPGDSAGAPQADDGAETPAPIDNADSTGAASSAPAPTKAPAAPAPIPSASTGDTTNTTDEAADDTAAADAAAAITVQPETVTTSPQAPTAVPTAVPATPEPTVVPPTQTPQPTAVPSPTPNPAASFVEPSPTATVVPGVAASQPDLTAESDDEEAETTLADPTPTPAVALSTAATPTPTPTATPEGDTSTLTGPAPRLPAGVDAVMIDAGSNTSGPCDTTNDGLANASCELFAPYVCMDQSEAAAFYLAVDSDNDGIVDLCRAEGLTSCDTVGDLVGDTPCIIELETTAG